ncbi:coiled-coil domain-containing protein 33 [Cheilinus undulatus]|uniref:coiled-coil domain-containing protein 33 n=1 Tax=Cheilinus undulatus TaxID=241271 RepID=UPI001BD6C86A|nr:coiled-coil domain-containing protein 33 [Cheilinus undulatus]
MPPGSSVVLIEIDTGYLAAFIGSEAPPMQATESQIRTEWGYRELLRSRVAYTLGWAALFEVPWMGLYLSSAAGVERSNQYNLPSHDALAQILPHNHLLSKGAMPAVHRETIQDQRRAERLSHSNRPNINNTYQIQHPHKRPPLHDFKDDHGMTEISSLQNKVEFENYRTAMSKMAEDIIVLRTQVVTLEAENSQLRIDLSVHQDVLNDTDTMTKADISKHTASLKCKVTSEISDAAKQRERIQRLQNNLIKKNDSEKELLKLQRAHKQLQEDHQSRLAKIATLEATVKQQEKVIEKMEKALDSKARENNQQSGSKRLAVRKQRDESGKRKEIETALAAENSHLRGELDRIQQQCNPAIKQQSDQTRDMMPIQEKMILLQKVEQAEARVQTLEAQLEENAKQWGKQKQEMLTKLSEHRHGFVRTSTTIFHNGQPLI